MIKIEGLKKNFGDFEAVKGLTLEISKGCLFAFLGPNGAGKTTTIKILTGLLKPTDGTIKLNGLDSQTQREEIKKFVSYMPDEPYLYEKLTGREYLDFVANIYKIPLEKKQPVLDRLVPLFKMEDKLDKLIEDYSHGMRQKLIIIATFLHYPKIILVDEPLVGLDPYSSKIFKQLIREFCNDGGTIFLSTHTLSVAEELADRIGIIKEGQLSFIGTLKDLRNKVQSESSLEQLFLTLTMEEGSTEIYAEK